MEGNGMVAPQKGEKGFGNEKREAASNGAEVVVVISGEEASNDKSKSKDPSSSAAASRDSEAATAVPHRNSHSKDFDLGSELEGGLKTQVQMSTITNCPSPETSMARHSGTTTPHKPPKIPDNVTPRKAVLSRSAFSKPKSRFAEPNAPNNSDLKEGRTASMQHREGMNSPYRTSPNNRISANTPRGGPKTAPVTPKTPLMSSPGGEEEDEELYKRQAAKVMEMSPKGPRVVALIEWFALLCIAGCLIASLTIPALRPYMIWELELWKWCVLVMVIVCGRLVTEWFIHILVFLIERNFLLKKKVLYFVYGLKQSVQVCVWLALVLLTWLLLFNHGVKRSRKATKILHFITQAVIAALTAAVIWLVKTILVKMLASSFHVNTFFDRIQESIFHQYVLQSLSGPPLMELAENIRSARSMGQVSFRSTRKEKGAEEVINVGKLQKMKQEKVSPWTMKGLINVVRSSGLSTISNTIDQIYYDGGQQQDKEITSEWEAKIAAYQIFQNVAKPGAKYIDEEDLLRFLSKEEVDNVLPLLEGAVETGKIKKSALRNWVVKVYFERKSLAHSLNDTKTAVRQLNKLISGAVIVGIIIACLLIMGVLTTKVIVFMSSQMLLVAFVFGNTCKTTFEAIIFVFVMHPFDVGDRCVIDGVQMIVEEMNILTTIFLRYDNEKIYYPNSVLSSKPISNIYRSPNMGDSVEFAIDVATPVERLGALKSRIKAYIDNKPQHWQTNHSVVVKEIENVNKMKLALYTTHTMNFQNMVEKNSRRTELVLELKKIFEELVIKYHLLPQDVHLSYTGTVPTALPTPRA